MRIECEFRDLKGPWGLDELAGWQDAARVTRFLGRRPVLNEWWLAWLWQHQLERWRPQFQLRGRLSWCLRLPGSGCGISSVLRLYKPSIAYGLTLVGTPYPGA